MEGEPVLNKASITQRQIGLHCVSFVSLFGDQRLISLDARFDLSQSLCRYQIIHLMTFLRILTIYDKATVMATLLPVQRTSAINPPPSIFLGLPPPQSFVIVYRADTVVG